MEFKILKSPIVKNLLRSMYYNSKVAKYISGTLNPSGKIRENPKLFGSLTITTQQQSPRRPD